METWLLAFHKSKINVALLIITTGGSKQQGINMQQEFHTNLCNTEPPGDEVMVTGSKDQVQPQIQHLCEGGVLSRKRLENREKKERESQQGNLITKTY